MFNLHQLDNIRYQVNEQGEKTDVVIPLNESPVFMTIEQARAELSQEEPLFTPDNPIAGAITTDVDDLSINHDHYLYGQP